MINNGKKILLILLILWSSIGIVIAASTDVNNAVDQDPDIGFITSEGKYPNNKKTHLPVSIVLGDISVQNIGFSSNYIQALDDVPNEITKMGITNAATIDGLFSSEEFYLFWKIVCGSSNKPSVSIQIQRPLHSAKANADVNWTVAWRTPNGKYDTKNNIIGSDPKYASSAEIVSSKTGGNENKLHRDVNSIVLKAETTDKWWDKPGGYYDSDLWIIINTK